MSPEDWMKQSDKQKNLVQVGRLNTDAARAKAARMSPEDFMKLWNEQKNHAVMERTYT
jgi:hypothetical protein